MLYDGEGRDGGREEGETLHGDDDDDDGGGAAMMLVCVGKTQLSTFNSDLDLFIPVELVLGDALARTRAARL